MKDNKIGFRYNPMFPVLEEQANKQGYTFGNNDLAILLERMRHDIFELHIVYDISTSKYRKLLQSFHNILIGYLKPL